MLDELLELSSLPNLHPALVHFPIALAAVGFLADGVAFVRRGSAAVEQAAIALWLLAAAGAGAAYVAGRAAAEDVGALSAPAEAALTAHADAGLASLAALGSLALLRAWFRRRGTGSEQTRPIAFRVVVLVAGGMALGVVAYTADLGGALVYRHGVAVSVPGAGLASPVTSTEAGSEVAAETRVEILEDGSLVWTPDAGDEAELGGILEPVGDVAVSVVRAPDGKAGLSLLASGRTLLLLPRDWNDVQLELQLDVSGFDGSVALGARVDGESGGFVRFRSDGITQLVVRRNGNERVLDEAKAGLTERTATIGLSAVGRHWKGFVDGRTAVHGHASPPTTGRVALIVDGNGPIRLISLRISPATAGGSTTGADAEGVHAG